MQIEITDANRDLYGGDCEITSTVPSTHPKHNIPLSGLRADIRGASLQYHTLYKGDIIYVGDPTLEYNFTWWPDDGTEWSKQLYMLLKIEKGFTEAEAKDWNIRPVLRMIIQDVNGRIVIPAARNLAGQQEYHVLMYRTKERWALERQRMHQSDVTTTAEKRMSDAVGHNSGVSVLPSTFETSTSTEHVTIR